MNKFITTAITLLIAITIFSGCTNTKNEGLDLDVSDIQENMLKAGENLPKMDVINSKTDSDEAKEEFTSLSDMDYNKVDSYFFAYSSEGLADEVAVIKLKKDKDSKEAEESLRKHIENRKSMFATYSPELVDTVEKGLVVTKGRYVALIISEDSSYIKAAMENMMEE